MRIESTRMLMAATAALFQAGCEQAGFSDSRGMQEPAVEQVHFNSSADAAWEALISSAPRLRRLAGEDDLSYFMRDVEASNLRFRELGLQFWEAHPDDPRRHEWLVLTVHMAPHYAVDASEWARNEGDHMHANGAAVDVESQRAWDLKYPGLRGALFASQEASDMQRRLLWFGELRDGLRRMKQAVARGENPDAGRFLQSYAGYLKAFPVHFPDDSVGRGEVKAHALTQQYLWEQVFEENREIFRWDAPSALAFLDRIEPYADETSSMPWRIEALRSTIAEAGAMPAGVTRYRGKHARDLSETEKVWLALGRNRNLRLQVLGSKEGDIITAYAKTIKRRVLRELGYRLWESHPDPQNQIRWFRESFDFAPPYLVSSFAEDVRLIAQGREDDISVDEKKKAMWTERLADLRAGFFADPRVTNKHKAAWIGVEMRPFENKLAGDQRDEGGSGEASPEEIAAFLAAVQALYLEYDNGAEAANRLANVIRYPGRYGLDDASLGEFIEPFRGADDKSLQNQVAWHDQRQRWKASPVEFKAPVFSGDGEELSAEDLRGKIVYIDGWATWCTGCIASMPELHEAYLAYKGYGFEFVSMVDDGTRQPKLVQRTLDKLNLTWPVLNTEGNEEALRVSANYMILNRDGTVYEYHDRKKRTLPEILDEMLAAEAAARGETFVPPQ